MISLSDNRIQQEITGVILVGRMYSVAANSPEIVEIVEYDLSEAERQLSIWQLRHQDDCDIERKNPLTLKHQANVLSGSRTEDPEGEVCPKEAVEVRRSPEKPEPKEV